MDQYETYPHLHYSYCLCDECCFLAMNKNQKKRWLRRHPNHWITERENERKKKEA